jgi:hypothetical protein
MTEEQTGKSVQISKNKDKGKIFFFNFRKCYVPKLLSISRTFFSCLQVRVWIYVKSHLTQFNCAWICSYHRKTAYPREEEKRD